VEIVLRRRAFSGSLFVILVFLVLAGLVSAQTASLQGVIKDPQDKVVPGADVTLTNKATGVERSTISDDAGDYQFAQVKPGLYQIKAELSGFKTVVVDELHLQVDTPTTIDLKFSEVGEISETIVVTAEKLLNKVDASIGNPFNELQIKQLPIESRNVVDLLKLQAGVTLQGYVAGARADQSNLTLDGIDVNEQQDGTAFESVLRVNPDSVQEFRVTTTNPNANQGRSSGAQVSLVTKSGTNRIHGSAYEYHRNTATTANDFFNNRVLGDPDNDGKQGIARPRLLRNLFGGAIGGPISKDKLFFFYNYEGRTDRKQTSVVREVPLANLGEGLVKYTNGSNQSVTLTTAEINSLFPAVGVNPVAVKTLKDAAQKYPANDDGAGDGINTGGFRFNAPLPLDWHTHTARIDYNPHQNHLLSVRANWQWDHEVPDGREQFFQDTDPSRVWTHPFGLMGSHSWTISNNILNTFRYGLTRQAFSIQGDSAEPNISFRDVFAPLSFSRTLSRTTPTHNLIDDFSWTKGDHTFQFGGNIRLIRNNRASYGAAFDSASINPYYYANSGQILLDPFSGDVAGSSTRSLQKGLASLIGRYTQYQYNFNFSSDGTLLTPGSPSGRTFATEEYDLYAQDTWRVSPSLTLTYGLRWGTSTPVYETQGYQVKPTVSLGEFFEKRKEGMAKGVPYNELITIDKAGKFYDKPGWYEQEWDNVAPRVAAAWSPSFDSGVLKAIFGSKRETVIRGGFAMLYDRIGSRLAVDFDLSNTLGFSSNNAISANWFNVTTRPGPQFTGFNQSLRDMGGLPIPGQLEFPLEKPADERQRIEMTLDDSLTTPVNYSWNLSWGRELPHGLFVEASYIGRAARDLLAQRDIMHLNNLKDPASGQTWYEAAGILEDNRLKGTAIEDIPELPFFTNMFPGFTDEGLTPTQLAYAIAQWPDFTYLQLVMDDWGGLYPNMFFHPQYAALMVWSNVAYSDYHAFTLTARERYKDNLSFDFNYTLSKSTDNASGLQNAGNWNSLIMNPLEPNSAHALSDFDVTHMINANWLFGLPFGKGRTWLAGANPLVQGILGGWDVNGIFRWNSGLNGWDPFTNGIWATNWNIMNGVVRLRDPGYKATKNPQPDADGNPRAPNLFPDPVYAYQSFRNATHPGEAQARNVLRLQGYIGLDLGIRKSFAMPWEGHRLTFMWDVFNVTNTQRLGGEFNEIGVGLDPFLSEPEPNWYTISNIQGEPRVMQFALRYDF
jgi:hypothetical protein